ncbi:MAG: hypothetical protein LQ346_006152 [Caloplaca aetnensis]|nr:MAG: hypothetical protein LQ346_006152 [Caloplaca aetnensis]
MSSNAPTFYKKPKGASDPVNRRKPSNPSTSASCIDREATKDNIVCYGCDRPFHSHASMMLHLEEGLCITTMAELGRIAEKDPDSDRYVARGWREYLRNEYGHGSLAVDTDHKTIWECVECRKGFFTLEQAKQHARSPAHKPMVFKCPGCYTSFSALSGVLQHVEMSGVCGEGLRKGSGAMGRLLSAIEERLKKKCKGSGAGI